MSTQKRNYNKILLTSATFLLVACGSGGGGGGSSDSENANQVPTIFPPLRPGDTPSTSIIAANPKLLSLIYLGDTAKAEDYKNNASSLLKDLSLTTMQNLYTMDSFKRELTRAQTESDSGNNPLKSGTYTLPSGITHEYVSMMDPGLSIGNLPGFKDNTFADLMKEGPVFIKIPVSQPMEPPEFPHIPGETKLTGLWQDGGYAFFEKDTSSSIGMWGLYPAKESLHPFDRRAFSYNPTNISTINANIYEVVVPAGGIEEQKKKMTSFKEKKNFPSLQIGGTSTVKARFVSIHGLPSEKLDISQIKLEALTNEEFKALGISKQDGLEFSYQYFPHLVEVLNLAEIEKDKNTPAKVNSVDKTDNGVFAFGDRVTAGNVVLKDKMFVQTVGVAKDASKAVINKVTLQDASCGFVLEAGKTLKVNTLDANNKTVNLKVKLSANTDTAPLEVGTISNAAAWSVSLDDYITTAEDRFEKKLFADGFDLKKNVPLVAHTAASLAGAKMDSDEKQFSGKSYKFSLDNKDKLLSMKVEEAAPLELFSASQFIAADSQFQGKNTDAVVAFAQEFNPSAHFAKGVSQQKLLASQHQLNLLRMGSDAQSDSNGFSGGIFAKDAAYVSFAVPNKNHGLSSQAALKYSSGSLQLMPYISGQYLKDDTSHAENKGSMTSVGTMLLSRTKVVGTTFTSSVGGAIAQYSSDFTAKAPFEGRIITASTENVTYNTAEISGGVHMESKGLGISTFLSLIGTFQPQKQKMVSMNYGQKSYDTPLSLGGVTYAFNAGALVNQSTKVGFSYSNNGDTNLSFSVEL